MSNNPLKILVLQTGHTSPSIAAQYGNFSDRFCKEAQKFSKTTIELVVYPICDQPKEPCPSFSNFAGVTMTGSSAMVDDSDPWIKEAINVVKRCLDEEILFLGICFGHQILGAATNCKVGINPNGRFVCSSEATLQKEDILLEGMPKTFKTQLSHRDVILDPSSQITVLGTAKHDPYHIIKAGKHAWGVQFHPEWSMGVAKEHAIMRKEKYIEEMGLERYQRFLDSFTETPDVARVLSNFVDYCARR